MAEEIESKEKNRRNSMLEQLQSYAHQQSQDNLSQQ